MLSLVEYESLEETLHLLRDPVNAERLLQSIKEAEEGKRSNITLTNEAPVERERWDVRRTPFRGLASPSRCAAISPAGGRGGSPGTTGSSTVLAALGMNNK